LAREHCYGVEAVVAHDVMTDVDDMEWDIIYLEKKV